MVLYKNGKVYLKIVYWGMGSSGKTMILKTLYRLTKETKRDIVPVGNLQILEKESGATLYFDLGIFQSTKEKMIYFRVFTIAGARSFSHLRVKIFNKVGDETDGVIFVVDSQTKFFEDNICSLLELKSLAGDRLIREIPLIILLNKQDLKDVIDENDIIQILKKEKLWYEPNEKLSLWNPPIYKISALFENQKDIYRSFLECIRRITDFNIPYSYIFKPPSPPDDLALAPRIQLSSSQNKEDLEKKINCQYCGRKLTKEEQLTHSCKKKPE